MIWPLTSVIIIGTIPGVIAGGLIRIFFLPNPHHFRLFMGLVLLFIGTRMLHKLNSTLRSPKGPRSPHGIGSDGIIGGAYGVGGGGIISPFLVSIFNLPVHTIAGATLAGTCITSLVGVLFFSAAKPMFGMQNVGPDWLLGSLFGLGGFFGIYLGAS